MLNRRQMLKLSAAAGAGLLAPWRGIDLDALPPAELGRVPIGVPIAYASQQVPQTPLAGKSIPRFVTPLPNFAGNRVTGATSLTVSMEEFQQQVLPVANPALGIAGYPMTWVWGYKIIANGTNTTYGPFWPGYTVEAIQGAPMTVTYINDLPSGPAGGHVQPLLTVDQSIHWANPLGVPMMVNGVGNPDFYTAAPPAVVHLHGGEVPSEFDGGPEAWFTSAAVSGGQQFGAGYRTLSGKPVPNSAIYQYPNAQEAATLWFHDHCLGATRLNVYAGLAAFYWLRDTRDSGLTTNPIGLPAGSYEIELAIQDRMFDTSGQLLFPDVGINPTIHPYWLPEFFGDVMVVNGATWPYFEVEPRRYRFRFLDGCNARFLEMRLMNRVTGTPGPAIWVIGSDGGLLDAPVQLPSPKASLFMTPGERYDTIIDFAGFQGQTLTLINTAKAPYPKGTPPNPSTTGQIMEFRVVKPLQGTDTSYNPAAPATPLRVAPIVRLASNGALATGVTAPVTRQLTLIEIAGAAGPLEVMLNNTSWDGRRPGNAPTDPQIPGYTQYGDNFLSELPQIGSTEVWEIVNLTRDAHPIHLHLVQFQLINRHAFNVTAYRKKYDSLFPGGTYNGVTYPPGVFIPAFGPPLDYFSTPKLGGNPDVTPYLQGRITLPNPEEIGWKDTLKMFPGEVTRIAVRWAPQDILVGSETPGTWQYGFDPTVANGALDSTGAAAPQPPGYVWHCHIVDHEDNEMMRPYIPRNIAPLGAAGQDTYLPIVEKE